MRNFKVRDRRNKGWFYMDNDYLNGYAKHFGAMGTSIYMSLCRHADGGQKCFPSQKLIAKELNIGERTVRDYLNHFAKYQLIHIQREKSEKGTWLNNVYTLLDKSEWIKPQARVASGATGKEIHKPKATDDSNQRQWLPHKDTNRKKTHIRKERHLKNSEERIAPKKREIAELVATFKV